MALAVAMEGEALQPRRTVCSRSADEARTFVSDCWRIIIRCNILGNGLREQYILINRHHLHYELVFLGVYAVVPGEAAEQSAGTCCVTPAGRDTGAKPWVLSHPCCLGSARVAVCGGKRSHLFSLSVPKKAHGSKEIEAKPNLSSPEEHWRQRDP